MFYHQVYVPEISAYVKMEWRSKPWGIFWTEKDVPSWRKSKKTYCSNAMISLFPVYICAKRRAKSLASEPEFTKKQTLSFSGMVLAIFLAHKTMLSWRKRLLVFKIAICSQTAWTTAGWQWPTKIYKKKELKFHISKQHIFLNSFN